MDISDAAVFDAFEWMSDLHEGKTDKNGVPYWMHPWSVAAKAAAFFSAGYADRSAVVTALLHDVIEDEGVSREEIANRFGEKVADDVSMVSKPKGLSYAEYVSSIANCGSIEAVCVKWCDLVHNSDPSRLSLLDFETKTRLEAKYGEAKNILLAKHPFLKEVNV